MLHSTYVRLGKFSIITEFNFAPIRYIDSKLEILLIITSSACSSDDSKLINDEISDKSNFSVSRNSVKSVWRFGIDFIAKFVTLDESKYIYFTVLTLLISTFSDTRRRIVILLLTEQSTIDTEEMLASSKFKRPPEELLLIDTEEIFELSNSILPRQFTLVTLTEFIVPPLKSIPPILGRFFNSISLAFTEVELIELKLLQLVTVISPYEPDAISIK